MCESDFFRKVGNIRGSGLLARHRTVKNALSFDVQRTEDRGQGQSITGASRRNMTVFGHLSSGLPRPLDNKGIRHGKVGKIPSLRGAQRRGNPESFEAAALTVIQRTAQRRDNPSSGPVSRERRSISTAVWIAAGLRPSQ
jgi:hypothetical protein